jgi:3-phosphoshikimate 1-carboxyvinyltransferase
MTRRTRRRRRRNAPRAGRTRRAMSERADTAPRPIGSGRAAIGSLLPPPSKSLTQRYFDLALLAATPSLVRRPLLAGDTEAYLAGLAGMGCAIERRHDAFRLTPPARPAEARIDCGAGGTMLRLLTAAACVVPGVWTLDGTARLQRRPLAPLLAALRGLGGRIECLESEGHAPLRVHGEGLQGGRVELDAGESSQYLSALLLAATRARSAVEIRVERLTSAPYVELTLAALGEFGVEVERPASDRYQLRPTVFPGREITVEADASAACYAAAAAALTGGRVAILGLRPDSRQGDLGFFELLRRMGAEAAWQGGRLAVASRGGLTAVSADLSAMPDQVPTLAALAPFAEGTTRITGVPHLRLKESDRLRAMAIELRRLGAAVEERPDGLEIAGVWSQRPPPDEPVTVSSHDDHRIAMSLALVGLRRAGVSVAEPGVVAKSYPAFWRDLERLLEPG